MRAGAVLCWSSLSITPTPHSFSTVGVVRVRFGCWTNQKAMREVRITLTNKFFKGKSLSLCVSERQLTRNNAVSCDSECFITHTVKVILKLKMSHIYLKIFICCPTMASNFFAWKVLTHTHTHTEVLVTYSSWDTWNSFLTNPLRSND